MCGGRSLIKVASKREDNTTNSAVSAASHLSDLPNARHTATASTATTSRDGNTMPTKTTADDMDQDHVEEDQQQEEEEEEGKSKTATDNNNDEEDQQNNDDTINIMTSADSKKKEDDEDPDQHEQEESPEVPPLKLGRGEGGGTTLTGSADDDEDDDFEDEEHDEKQAQNASSSTKQKNEVESSSSSTINNKEKKGKNKSSSSADQTKEEASYVDHSNTIFNEISGRERSALQLYHEDTVGGPFPIKLQILLKVVEKIGKQHIIAWLPHGRSFIIHRPREFERDLMGQFFNNTKFSSFKRQLNLYDFKRVTHGANGGSYYHELFLRGKPLLATKMVRRKIKGNMRLSSASTRENGPEFYSMPFLGPASTSDYPQDDFNSFNMLSRATARDQHANPMYQHHHNHHQPSSMAALHSMGRGDMNMMDDPRLASSSMLSRLQHQHQNSLGGFQPSQIPSDSLLLNNAIGSAAGAGAGGRGLLPPYADETSRMLSSGAGGISDIVRHHPSRGLFDDPSFLRNSHNYQESLSSIQQQDNRSNLLQSSAAAFGTAGDSLGPAHSRLPLQHMHSGAHQHLLANNSMSSSLSPNLQHHQQQAALQDAALQDHLLLQNQLLHKQLLQQMSSSERPERSAAAANFHHLNDLAATKDRLNSAVGVAAQLPPLAYNANISNMTASSAAFQGLGGSVGIGGGIQGASSSPMNHPGPRSSSNTSIHRDLSSSLVNEQDEVAQAAETMAARAAAMRGGYLPESTRNRNNDINNRGQP